MKIDEHQHQSIEIIQVFLLYLCNTIQFMNRLHFKIVKKDDNLKYTIK